MALSQTSALARTLPRLKMGHLAMGILMVALAAPVALVIGFINGLWPDEPEKAAMVVAVLFGALLVVKSIENAYRHAEIALAFELTRAYPNMDMRTVLELVGTKWNVGTFHPSFGVGGYCIPLSSYYVIGGAEKPEELQILRQAIATCESQPHLLAHSLIQRGVRNVGILGLSYTHNVKVWAQSPTLAISAILTDAGVNVKVHDPNFTAEEIYKISGMETFDFPGSLDEFDTVLVVAGHREYRLSNHREILPHLTNCKLVLDNSGFWREVDFESRGIEYYLPGEAHWMDGVSVAHVDRSAAPVGD